MGKKKEDKKEPKVLDIPGFGDVMKELDKLTIVKPGKSFKKDGVTYHAKGGSLNEAIARVKKEQGFRNGGKVSLENFKGTF